MAVRLASRGYNQGMRIGDTEIRPLGGGIGCLAMIVVSVLLSVACTFALNLFAR